MSCTYNESCIVIMNYYGAEAQKRKLQEECAELIRAIARGDEENMLEEMADVQILLDQFRFYGRNIGHIDGIKAAKIERTLKHIEAEKKEQAKI